MSERRGEKIWGLHWGKTSWNEAARKMKAPLVYGLLIPFSL